VSFRFAPLDVGSLRPLPCHLLRRGCDGVGRCESTSSGPPTPACTFALDARNTWTPSISTVWPSRGVTLRRALLHAAFTGHLNGRASDADQIEELAAPTPRPTPAAT